MRISQRFSPESCFWANSRKKVSVCKAVAFTLLFKTCRVQCNAKSLFVFGWKNVVIFGMCARHIVICIASINSSTRRVHLKLTQFSIKWKFDATFESKENGLNGLFVLWRVSFSFLSFPKFNCLLTYIKCALFSMRVVYRCFMLFSYLHWTPKKGLTELYFDELRTSKWKRCKCCCAMDEFRHISLSASKTSNECCLGSYEYACQMYSHYKRIHWFDISFDGISGFLFLDCANCFEPYFISELEQQPSNKF